ncbi:MAG: DUF642 domain-containing protein [Planctomycetota bacterium]
MIRVSAGVVLLLSSVAVADVVNGSFEVTALNAPGRVGIDNLSDWTASGGFSLLERGLNNISNITAHSGEQFVSMGHSGQSNDRLAQTIDTVAGVQYSLEFWVATIQNSTIQTVAGSAFDAASTDLLGTVDGVVTNTTDGWVQYSVNFTAASDRTEIELLHTVASGLANVGVDSVSVTVVPTPAAGVIAAIGLAGMTRRKR